MLYRASVPLKDIQARLGRSRWQTTADWCIEGNAGQQNAAEINMYLLPTFRRTLLPQHFTRNCYRNCYQRKGRDRKSLKVRPEGWVSG